MKPSKTFLVSILFTTWCGTPIVFIKFLGRIFESLGAIGAINKLLWRLTVFQQQCLFELSMLFVSITHAQYFQISPPPPAFWS